jgi:hypothetical protein
VTTSSGSRPASYAATRQRSTSRGRGLRVGEGGDDGELVGVGDDHPLDRVGVVGAAPQQRRALLDPHDPRQRAGVAGDVADQRHPVADDDAGPAELAGLHRGDDERVLAGAEPADQAAVTAAVDGEHLAPTASACCGRSFVRGPRPARVGPDPTSDSSGSRPFLPAGRGVTLGRARRRASRSRDR